MKIPMLSATSKSSKRSEGDRVEEAVIDAIKESNNKTIEIRPANKSKIGRISRVLLFVGAVIGLSYWMRKSQKPKEMLQSAKSETADRTKEMSDQAADRTKEMSEQAADRTKEMSEQAADRTKEMSEQAAETIQEGGETVAERVEEGSQAAGEQIEQTGEEAAEATEQAGEEAAEKADEDGSN